MKKVYLFKFGVWVDVLYENEAFIAAKDADGVVTYVIKDGSEQVRVSQ